MPHCGHGMSSADDEERSRLRWPEIGFVFQGFTHPHSEIPRLRLSPLAIRERRGEALSAVGAGPEHVVLATPRSSSLELSGGELLAGGDRARDCRESRRSPTSDGNLDSATGREILAILEGRTRL